MLGEPDQSIHGDPFVFLISSLASATIGNSRKIHEGLAEFNAWPNLSIGRAIVESTQTTTTTITRVAVIGCSVAALYDGRVWTLRLGNHG